ncbi:hypothetical protein D7Y13_05325 [Corallococcus praedator]|uniref:UvrD-like helicase ATP-binding domain-containing protein n=1 Tax=Corallococcus praedator TaxID=2316724 RepID=A0ABX9QPH8_9BACT|nr:MULTISPECIES: UvrD-helicase domain-containing protein [Corallococcus]RKH34156.1 hypothetical protein D7X75_09425 [Corallococcus sp. CA031C]RKI14891.1 hypothetical protein D7Y13_05325 [Corallococcus praedator]
MKFILIDHRAASDIISDRFLQSAQFTQGSELASILQGAQGSEFPTQGVYSIREADGAYILSKTPDREHYLVFDLDKANPFTNRSQSDCVLIFQRVLRFAIRIWENLKLSPHERLIAGTTKAAIFPFPLSLFRLAIERQPDAKKLHERQTSSGNHLLVYNNGMDEGAGPDEKPSVHYFSVAIRNIETARQRIAELGRIESEKAKALTVSVLRTPDGEPLTPHLGFEQWLHRLTETQRNFVMRPISGPERIEGPAGTGKTLSLVLKCINNLQLAKKQERENHSVFIAYGEATRIAVQQMFDTNDEFGFSRLSRRDSQQSLLITTLQVWCASHLNTGISEVEFLDRDAMEARDLRLLYIEECLSEAIQEDLPTYTRMLSKDFAKFLNTERVWTIAEMFQHEISVTIKGRAGEDLEKYRRLPAVENNLPIKTDADRGFVFTVFKRYQKKLFSVNQFDTDDVVLSAIGQLDTPIWRRHRIKEGFDSVFVDETHLFNLNELSALHYLTKTEGSNPIVFSVDRTQAPGDRGLTNAILDTAILSPAPENSHETKQTTVDSVFRCSPDITNLALSVTAAGATLFTNFENPLHHASSVFTPDEESKAKTPDFFFYPTDDQMIVAALSKAEQLTEDLQCSRSKILLVAFSAELFHSLETKSETLNKPLEVLKRRGDAEVVSRAKKTGRFVLSMPDYVGGLEFDGVVLVGVDDGRVPPTGAAATSESRHFMNFIAHTRLYVAITRARYRVTILGNKERGESTLLTSAFANRFLSLEPKN